MSARVVWLCGFASALVIALAIGVALSLLMQRGIDRPCVIEPAKAMP